MAGFLYSLWDRAAAMGGDTILGTYNRIVGVKFKDNAVAEGFVAQAHNTELWHDYLPTDVIVTRSDSLVLITWPDGMNAPVGGEGEGEDDEPVTGPIAVAAAGAGSTSDSGTVTFSGGPAEGNHTVTVTAAVDGGSDIVVTHDFEEGDEALAVATAVKSAINAEADLTAVRDGLAITVTPATGTSLTKLTAAIA